MDGFREEVERINDGKFILTSSPCGYGICTNSSSNAKEVNLGDREAEAKAGFRCHFANGKMSTKPIVERAERVIALAD